MTRRPLIPAALLCVGGLLVCPPAGPAQSCRLVRDIAPGGSPSSPSALTCAFGDRLFFSASDSRSGLELWVLDDSTGALTGIDIDPVAGSDPRGFAELGRRVVFSAQTAAQGREPWISDGTAAGTLPLGDLVPGGTSSDPDEFVSAGNLVFFTATDAVAGRELWSTDGTSAGTRRVADIRPGTLGSNPHGLIAYGNAVLLSANDGVVGDELWTSDGTTAGTRLVRDLNPGTNNGAPDGFTRHDGAVYFSARDRHAGVELWITDGTPNGTSLYADIHPSGDSRPAGLVSFGSRLLFAANGPGVGIELFGTLPGGGVGLVHDIRPGGPSSSPRELVAADGRVWFRASDGPQGNELWSTDGTSAGTVSSGDLRAGGTGSQPTGLVAFGARCYFVADDGSGDGLWMAELPGVLPQRVCTLTAPRGLELCGCRLYCGAVSDPLLSVELHAVEDLGAAVRGVGAGCIAGMSFEATMPRLGSIAMLQGRNAPPGTLGLLVFDAALRAPQPLPGPLACEGRVQPLIVLGPMVGTPAAWSFGLPIPNDPALQGICLPTQSWWIATAPLAVVTTRTLLLSLGT